METQYKAQLKAIVLNLRHILEGRYDNGGIWHPGDLEERLAALGVRRDRERYIAVDAAAIDPVMDLTIEKLLKREASRMDELKQRLLVQETGFEEKYGLNSEEFRIRYEKGALGDDMDYVEWSVTVDMLAGAEKRLSLLQQGASA